MATAATKIPARCPHGMSLAPWFYPVCPGDPNYIIGSPLFDRATLKLGNGKTFTITAHGNGWQEYYIRFATLNDEALEKELFQPRRCPERRRTRLHDGGSAQQEMGCRPGEPPAFGPCATRQVLGKTDQSEVADGEGQ